MHCCAAEKPCCLRSTSLEVCSKRHDVHCIDCKLYSHLFSLEPEEVVTVSGGDDLARRLRDKHTKNSLIPWAKHHKIKNYCRLNHGRLCEHLAKAISGDNSVKSGRTRRPKRRKRKAEKSENAVNVVAKNRMPLGYKTCICGTDECKQAMVDYFHNSHDYSWPDKLFPWLYVNLPKMPRENVKNSTKGARARQRDLNRLQKLQRTQLFYKHLQLKPSDAIKGVVAVPVHFPLIL